MTKRGQRGKECHAKIVFRGYIPEHLRLSIDVEIFIPKAHLVGVVSQAVDLMTFFV